MTEVQVTCSNPACRIAETGKCVEGNSIDECSFYGKYLEIQIPEVIEDRKSTRLRLPNGAALNVEKIVPFLCRGNSRVIAVIGPRDTGKTSLIASIYDMFQTGTVGNIFFARSSTLHAFEMACHDSRSASMRDVPHMERTGRGQVLFYHLELGLETSEENVALLLGDRSGEEYYEVADKLDAAIDLVEVKRADSITILVDGARLLHSGKRHNTCMDVRMIMQGLSDSGILRKDVNIALVLTKLDIIDVSKFKERVETDFLELHRQLLSEFSDSVGLFEMFRVAAAPKITTVNRGTGIEALIDFWLKEPPFATSNRLDFPKPIRAFARIEPIED